MAKITIKPIEPLELEFADGTVRKALFNNEAFILFTEEFGDIEQIVKEAYAQENPYEVMSKVLYCGLKIVHPMTTLEEAESIMYAGGTELLLEIVDLLMNNFQMRTNDEVLKKFMDKLSPKQKTALKNLGML